MMKAGIAANNEEAVKLLDVKRMTDAKSYEVQVTLILPNCPWKVAHAILDIRAGTNVFKLEAIDSS